MNVGIVGLGLIGGSLARAIKENTNHTVYGFDKDKTASLAARLAGATDGELDEKALSVCDIVIISVYPGAAEEYIEENREKFKKGAIVTDTCGVKRKICGRGFSLAEKFGFYFIGGHPMAGTQYSGFSKSRANLFKGATVLLCARPGEDVGTMEKLREFYLSAGFAAARYTDPEKHDRMIALTSQLAHVVSNAYVKSPNAEGCRDYAAGSYRDMTRVAKLNAEMWGELFSENGDNLCREIELLAKNLLDYSDAIKSGDTNELKKLLSREGND